MPLPADQLVDSPDVSYRAVFRVKGFPRMTVSALASRTGARMYSLLLVLFVLDTYHSAALAGLVVLVAEIPGLFIAPFAGALLDRAGKNRLIAIDYGVAAVAITAVTVLSLLHELSVGTLFGIVGISSFTQPLSTVGTRSLFPLMVPKELWTRANGVDNSGFVIATVAGPAIGGLAIAVLGAKLSLLFPAALFLIGAFSILGVAVPAVKEEHDSLLDEAVGAVRYVYNNRVLRLLTMATAGFNVANGTVTVAVPVLVLRHLHGGSESVGVLFAVMGVVGFATSIIVGSRSSEGNVRISLVGSLGVSTVALSLLALSAKNEPLAVAGLCLVGFSNGAYQVCMLSLRQRVTDPVWFGRALAVSMYSSGSAIPLSSALIGALVGHSLSLAFFVAAAITFFGGMWPALRASARSNAPAPPVVVAVPVTPRHAE